MLNSLLKWLSIAIATIKIKETMVVKGPLILRDVGLFKVPNLHQRIPAILHKIRQQIHQSSQPKTQKMKHLSVRFATKGTTLPSNALTNSITHS